MVSLTPQRPEEYFSSVHCAVPSPAATSLSFLQAPPIMPIPVVMAPIAPAPTTQSHYLWDTYPKAPQIPMQPYSYMPPPAVHSPPNVIPPWVDGSPGYGGDRDLRLPSSMQRTARDEGDGVRDEDAVGPEDLIARGLYECPSDSYFDSPEESTPETRTMFGREGRLLDKARDLSDKEWICVPRKYERSSGSSSETDVSAEWQIVDPSYGKRPQWREGQRRYPRGCMRGDSSSESSESSFGRHHAYGQRLWEFD